MDRPEPESGIPHSEGRQMMQKYIASFKPSRWKSWSWSEKNFNPIANWLKTHSDYIRKGSYVSHTPGKEVWRFQLPKNLGEKTVIFKKYDFTQLDLQEQVGFSPIYHHVANNALFRKINIRTPDILACGETRHFGFLTSAFLILEYIQDTFDGSLLTPTDAFIDNSKIRMAFGLKMMEHFALIHQNGFSYSHFHAHTILIPKSCNEDNLDLFWTDIAPCRPLPPRKIIKIIPRNLLEFFIELRFDTDQIKTLCEHYLQFNPIPNFNTDILWNSMLAIKP